MVDRTDLKTERLLLRPFRMEDVDDSMRAVLSPGWNEFLPVPWPYTRKDAEEFVAASILSPWDRRAQFVMVLDGKMVGSITVRVEREHRRADIGYSISSYQWGKGLMPEGLRAVLT